MRRSLLVPLFVLACAPAASARVVVVAGGNRAATLVDVSTNAVAARVTLPGRTRTVAVAPDGSRAWFGVGSRVIAVDLASRAAALPIAVRGRISALTMSADGERLYAARRGAIDAIDTTTGAVAGAIRTGAAPIRALAASPDGTRLGDDRIVGLEGDDLLDGAR